MESDLDELIRGRRTIVCVGPGGVGKTTTSAAIGVRAAILGHRTLVLTIDPAHRLANALGLAAFEHHEQAIDASRFEAAGVPLGAPLYAMMLDTRRTFDDVVRRYAGSEEVQQRILNSPFYEQASTRLAGSQEYMAMEKLYELSQEGRYDLIVLDTPPTMHALDFLDAPDRLEAFMSQNTEGLVAKSTRVLSSIGLSFLKANSLILQGVGRFLGTDLFLDILAFLGDFKSMYSGFRDRARSVKTMMRSNDVGFIVLSGSEPSSVDEGLFFVERLREEEMPLLGYVMNRVRLVATDPAATEHDVRAALTGSLTAAGASYSDAAALIDKLRACHEQAATIGARDALQLRRARASLTTHPVWPVPDFDEDIHDLAGLYRYGQRLAAANGSGE